MNEIKFAEWLAENHWRLCDIQKIHLLHIRTCYWKSDSEEELGKQTTKQLYDIFNTPK
jgi:hypothetical protein